MAASKFSHSWDSEEFSFDHLMWRCRNCKQTRIAKLRPTRGYCVPGYAARFLYFGVDLFGTQLTADLPAPLEDVDWSEHIDPYSLPLEEPVPSRLTVCRKCRATGDDVADGVKSCAEMERRLLLQEILES